MFNVITIVFLGSWFLLSILWQFKFKFLQPLQQYDILQMLPNWTFFAPNPGTSDYHLIYQVHQDDEAADWKEIPIIQNRSLLHFFLNLEKRKLKTLIDSIHGIISTHRNNLLMKFSDEDATKALSISVAYLLLLKSVENDIKGSGVRGQIDFQFAIVETFGFIPKNEPRVIVTSTIHTT